MELAYVILYRVSQKCLTFDHMLKKLKSYEGLHDEITEILRSLINFRHQNFVIPTNIQGVQGVFEVQVYVNAETRGL